MVARFPGTRGIISSSSWGGTEEPGSVPNPPHPLSQVGGGWGGGGIENPMGGLRGVGSLDASIDRVVWRRGKKVRLRCEPSE